MLSVMVTRLPERPGAVRPAVATPRPTSRIAAWIGSGVAAGAAGTAVMTTTARIHRVLAERGRRRHAALPARLQILDYDDSDHVVIAASAVLRGLFGWAPRSPRGRRALFLLVHWGYGSAVGIAHRALRDGLGREPAAGIVFFVGCETMALTLFPVLGETPPPWRWRTDLLVTSLVQHAVYAAVVASTTRALTPTPTWEPHRR